MVEDGSVAFAPQVEVAVVGEVDVGWLVADSTVIKLQFVVVGKGEKQGDRFISGEGPIPRRNWRGSS